MKKLIKWLLIVTILTSLLSISLADFDLDITNISLSNWWSTVSLFSKPKINITIKNNWPNTIQNTSPIWEWFIKCIEVNSQNEIFRSSAMSTFIVNAWTEMIAGNLELKDTLTQTQRSVEISCSVNEWWNFSDNFDDIETTDSNNYESFSFNVDKLWRFDSSIDRAIDPIRWNLDAAEPGSMIWWWDTIRSFVFNKIINVITPIIIIVWILVWIIWAYRLFFSDSAEEIKKWLQLIIYWVLWIIIIISARYIWTVIFEDLFQSWDAIWINWVDLSVQLYEKIAFPFIKIVLYLALWILFIVLAAKVFSFITKSDWSSQKKAWTMIARSTISMLIIIASKQIVEAIYGKQNEVMNESAQTLWEIWSWLLADKNIPILYSVINRVMWLTSLVILVIILFQTFQILINPDKADNWQKIGKSIIYILIWVLIIWAWYLITNFLIIN